jgi:hypothetical protein
MTKFLQNIVAPVVSAAKKAVTFTKRAMTALVVTGAMAFAAVFGLARQFSAFIIVAALMFVFSSGAFAQTEAHSIISAVETAFDLIVPICVSIVSFFVVIRLAKRVVS